MQALGNTFAVFMDYVVYPIAWLCSPKLREHQRYVALQNAHLDGTLHRTPDLTCWYCRAREDWRQQRQQPQ